MKWQEQGLNLVKEFPSGSSITITPKYAGDAPTKEWYVSITDVDNDMITNKTVFGASRDVAVQFAEVRAEKLGWFDES